VAHVYHTFRYTYCTFNLWPAHSSSQLQLNAGARRRAGAT